jgi:protoporphyrinogen oxidase/GT2 family glycosyltransferase
LARTETYKGYRFDVGGHRFYTKEPEVHRLWQEVLGEDLLTVRRLSRIYYNGRFFRYPVAVANLVANLGPVELLRMLGSYCRARFLPLEPEDTFEAWVTNRFGRRLYRTFFKTYTEKVWGVPCTSLRADWAAQRIKGLSLITAAKKALFGGNGVRSLSDEFRYPRLGPGQMWEAFRARVERLGGSVRLNTAVRELHHERGRITRVRVQEGERQFEVAAQSVISSAPLSQLVFALRPAAPPEVIEAARGLRYRDFLIVTLIVGRPDLFPDNWLYIHSPEVRVGRIQNFKNWSKDMVPDPSRTSLGMEYFCSRGDDLWERTDEDLIALASRELEALGLARAAEVCDACVIRQRRAYPVYDETYRRCVEQIRAYLSGFGNLQTIGRNGLHRYNNQDHSVLCGLYAARNVLGATHDLWDVNTDRSYYEEQRPAGPSRGGAGPGVSPPPDPQTASPGPTVSVIVPVHNGGVAFARCLAALRSATPRPLEIIVVSDGGTDGSAELAEQSGVCVLREPLRNGPAAARNRGARAARGELVLFLDADVEVGPRIISQVTGAFRRHPEAVAVMGSYDEEPAATNFVSQYKNLFHHYTHQQAREEAFTFWAGCGAVRREAFLDVGGFDETYSRPSIEDIELGYRLKSASHRIRLCKDLQVKHLKRWSPLSLLRCDFFDRALPWTALILKAGRLENDLNLGRTTRLKIVLAHALVLAACLSIWRPGGLVAVALLGILLLALDVPLLRFFARKRGPGFALAAVAYHGLYYLCCGQAFALGLVLHHCRGTTDRR